MAFEYTELRAACKLWLEDTDSHVLACAPARVHTEHLDPRHAELGKGSNTCSRVARPQQPRNAVKEVQADRNQDVWQRGRRMRVRLLEN